MLYREAGQFKTSYAADQQIFPISQDRVVMVAILLFAFVGIPLFANQYWLSAILTPFLIFALAAIGLNLLTGYAGQLSLGTAAFMAVGFVAGSWLGARVATAIHDNSLKLVFGFVLIYVAGYTIFAALFGKEEIKKSMFFSFVLLGVSVGVYLLARQFAPPAPARG